jgi:transposase-like protein
MNITQIYQKYPTHNDCIAHLETVRWPGGPRCPYCGSDKSTRVTKENRHHCYNCKTSYSVTVNTIFHDTKLDLQKWFLAISLVLNAKKGISSRQLARDIEVNKNTAWYMGMRIRRAMIEHGELLKGIVEVDETYVGGKPRKGNSPKNGKHHKRGRGTDKIPVVGVVERGGRVRAKVAKNLKAKSLARFIREKVDIQDVTVMTDDYNGYATLKYFVKHETINHKEAYVCGNIHTNSIESFWAILKRGMIGQYHKVSARHLGKYVDEFCYRYNHRRDPNVFALTLSRAVGAIH